MHCKKFIFMFVAWYCVNTMNGSPISFENKFDCGNKCKTDETGIKNNDHQWNLQQAGDSNHDLHLPAFTGQAIPKKTKRQTNNDDTSGGTGFSPETTIAPDPVNATTQTDSDEQSTQVPLLRKGEIDFTDSAEYKRAQENLLSASEQVKVKDVQVTAPDNGTSSDDKNLPNTNFLAASIQDIKEIENVEDILTKNDSTSSNSSTTNPISSKTEISMEIKGAESVAMEDDGIIKSGSVSEGIPVVSENTTAETMPTAETRPTTHDSSESDSNAAERLIPPNNFINEPVEATSDDNASEDALIQADNLSKSGTSAEKTGLKPNTTHANADMEYSTPMGDTKNRPNPEDLTENKLNAVVTDPVKIGEVEVQENTTENLFNAVAVKPAKSNETGGDSFPNSTDSKSDPKTVSIPGELYHNVTDEDDSMRRNTTKKLDVEPEQLGIPKLQGDTINSISVNITNDARDIETEDVTKNDKDISAIPNSPTTSPNASKGSNHKNHTDSETRDDDNFVNQYESHTYNLDDWDDDFTDTSSFDDFTENPCDCSRTKNPINFGIFVENDPTASIEYPPHEPFVEHFHPPDYSTNYGNIGENLDEEDVDVEYSQHTDDNLSDFPDDFDSEDLDDLLNSDIDFNTKEDHNYDHFDEGTDDFVFDDIFR